MAAAVFGGSPRHHNRNIISNNATTIETNMTNANIAQGLGPTIQQLPPIRSSSLGQTNKIIFPLQSYVSTSSMPNSSTQHYRQTHQSLNACGQLYGQPLPLLPPAPPIRSRTNNRKTAVELLAESKPFYVKSETVLDRQQQLSYRRNAAAAAAVAAAAIISPTRTPLPHQRTTTTTANRRSSSSSSDLLQNKLRTLLNAAGDSKESLSTLTPPEISPKYDRFMSPKSSLNQQLMVNADPDANAGDVSVFFPTAFVSPQSLPLPHPSVDDDLYSSYNVVEQALTLTDEYQTISPPAEYAESSKLHGASIRGHSASTTAVTYQRSYSHSQAVASDEADYSPSSYNINSHKSMPDLHSQTCRHSPHSSEALSSCSRGGGNRSNKSNSSLNRDSGASSGHYTHRSEPCCKQQLQQQQQQQQQKDLLLTKPPIDIRRDSGSSTQHSGNSYYAYGIPPSPPIRSDCTECRVKDVQSDANCLLNYTTLEVPEAFQDAYPDMYQHQTQRSYDITAMAAHRDQQRSFCSRKSTGSRGGNCAALPPPPPKKHTKANPENELSPPLGTFKRQRCLRVKQRGGGYSSPSDRNCRTEDDRRPILRSKSDIGGDRHWHRGTLSLATNATTDESVLNLPLSPRHVTSPFLAANSDVKRTINLPPSSVVGSLSLEQFFEHLGLTDETYDKDIAPTSAMKKCLSSSVRCYDKTTDESTHSSPVFFSDTSTIDSNRLPDSTETSKSVVQPPYRPSEPTSIVERNARIIKWLCNCRKLSELS